MEEEMIPETLLEVVAHGDMQVLWKHLRMLADEYVEINELMRDVKYGVSLRFNINHYIKDNFVVKAKSGLVLIDKKTYKLEEFWDEMDNRESLARKIIYKYMEDEEALKPRN